MGYADAGFNGGKDIKTTNLDPLARGGANPKSFIGETRNLAAEHPDKFKELRTKHEEMMSTAAPSGEAAGGFKK